jgi:cytochrome c556
MRVLTVATGALLAMTPHAAISQTSEYKLGEIVVAREAMMFDLQNSYWSLLKVKNGESDDFQSAGEVARYMSDIMADFVPLLKKGTARGEAPGSRVKPEVWNEPEAFAAVANDFRMQATALADIAESRNPATYAEAFDTFTGACTGCHGLRPSSGGRFRYAIGE